MGNPVPATLGVYCSLQARLRSEAVVQGFRQLPQQQRQCAKEAMAVIATMKT